MNLKETGDVEVENNHSPLRKSKNTIIQIKNPYFSAAANEDGYHEVLGAAEGMKEDKTSWVTFFQWMRSRDLDSVRLGVGDKCLGMLEAVGEVFPESKYQRYTVHFYRYIFSVTPHSKMKQVAKILKAIHAQ